MKCRQCGTEIADKALVCYRCGTATSDPVIKPPSRQAPQSHANLLVSIIGLVVLGLIALYVGRNVEPGSPADQAGVQAGDVIVGVGDKKVTSPSEAANAIRGAGKDHAVALRILRNGEAMFVGVNLDQSSEG